MKTLDEFLRKVAKNPESGCWVWTGNTIGKKGYGYVVWDGRRQRAHRVSYSIHHGEIPDGMWVLHRCDNPPCVNPDHLYLGTNQENVRDRIERRRTASGDSNGARTRPDKLARGNSHGTHTHPESRSVGTDNGAAKLNADAVREIRRMHAEGYGSTTIAKQFGVHEATVISAATRRTWKHVD